MAETYQLEYDQDFNFRNTRRRETQVVPLSATTLEDAQSEAGIIVDRVAEEIIPNIRSGAIGPRIKRVVEDIQLS